MENQKNQLTPTNNKALFHSLANLYADLRNKNISVEDANALCNVAGKMQKSLEIEINAAKTNYIITNGEKVRIREIEITNPEH